MPIDARELAHRVEAAIASGLAEQDFDAGGGATWQFRRTPAPGVDHTLRRQRADGQVDAFLTKFAAAVAPPPGYPADGPFLPEQPVSVTGLGTAWSALLWEEVNDPAPVLSMLEAELCAEGWKAQALPAGMATLLATAPPIDVRIWQREGRIRIMQVTRERKGTIVMLTNALGQAPKPASSTGGTGA